jgi:hypothetical protein
MWIVWLASNRTRKVIGQFRWPERRERFLTGDEMLALLSAEDADDEFHRAREIHRGAA